MAFVLLIKLQFGQDSVGMAHLAPFSLIWNDSQSEA